MGNWQLRADDGRMLSITTVETEDGPRVAVNVLRPEPGEPLLYPGERAQEIRRALAQAIADTLHGESWRSS